MDDKCEFLPIHILQEPRNKLRLVDTESVQFLELCDSLRDTGFLNSILVRPLGDRYEIVDGFCRYTAARTIGMEFIPCLIREIPDDKILSNQIQANAISLETTPAEYAIQLKRMMALDPDLTIREVSCLIRKSPNWVGNCLSLANLLKDCQKMVDRGEIPLQNAYMLAKIPRSMQKDYVERSITMSAKEFKIVAAACVKQFTEAVKQGRMDAFYSDKFEPVAYLRSLKDIEIEMSNHTVGALVCTGEGSKTVLDGFYAGLRWACHLDHQSVLEQEAAIRSHREKEILDVTPDN